MAQPGFEAVWVEVGTTHDECEVDRTLTRTWDAVAERQVVVVHSPLALAHPAQVFPPQRLGDRQGECPLTADEDMPTAAPPPRGSVPALPVEGVLGGEQV